MNLCRREAWKIIFSEVRTCTLLTTLKICVRRYIVLIVGLFDYAGNPSIQPLSWDIRLKIAIGAARGLAFLHTSEKKVIYRDFKASNILLDGVGFYLPCANLSKSILDYTICFLGLCIHQISGLI